MMPSRSLLDDAGLNRQHVFDLALLPGEILAPLAVQAHERQLILFAHAGRRLWAQVQAEGDTGPDPIDRFSTRRIEQWFAATLPQAHFRFVYPHGLPRGQHVGLQGLGALAGWHHASPFKVGIDSRWGSWFAYRAAVLADTALPPSQREDLGHPCLDCVPKPCIAACPAHALDSGTMDFAACRAFRLADDSPCALRCLAREACPVGAEHRYEPDQIRHSAAGSLAVLRRLPVPRAG